MLACRRKKPYFTHSLVNADHSNTEVISINVPFHEEKDKCINASINTDEKTHNDQEVQCSASAKIK